MNGLKKSFHVVILATTTCRCSAPCIPACSYCVYYCSLTSPSASSLRCEWSLLFVHERSILIDCDSPVNTCQSDKKYWIEAAKKSIKMANEMEIVREFKDFSWKSAIRVSLHYGTFMSNICSISQPMFRYELERKPNFSINKDMKCVLRPA